MEPLNSHHFDNVVNTQGFSEHIDWRRSRKVNNIPGSLYFYKFYTYQSLNTDTETTSRAPSLRLFWCSVTINLNITNGSQNLKREYCGQALSMLGSARVRVFL